jgi:hypothetical protein
MTLWSGKLTKLYELQIVHVKRPFFCLLFCSSLASDFGKICTKSLLFFFEYPSLSPPFCRVSFLILECPFDYFCFAQSPPLVFMFLDQFLLAFVFSAFFCLLKVSLTIIITRRMTHSYLLAAIIDERIDFFLFLFFTFICWCHGQRDAKSVICF